MNHASHCPLEGAEASMGPRSDNRGYGLDDPVRGGGEQASMGPRSDNRGYGSLRTDRAVDDAQKVYHFDGQELDQTRLPGEVDMQLGLGEWRGHFFSPGVRLDLEERALSRAGVLSAGRQVTRFAARWAGREFAFRGGRRTWLRRPAA